MNYFDYQPNYPMGRVWSLFTQLGELSEEEILGSSNYYNISYAHTLEIVRAALSGALSDVSTSEVEFNLKAYEVQCAKNDVIDYKKQVEKLLFIVDDTGESEEDLRVGFGDISERKLKKFEKDFDNIEALQVFESNINELLHIRNEYITTHGVDLVSILSNSLKGIPDALDLLTKLVSNNKRLNELIVSLCETGDEGVLLKRLSVVM